MVFSFTAFYHASSGRGRNTLDLPLLLLPLGILPLVVVLPAIATTEMLPLTTIHCATCASINTLTLGGQPPMPSDLLVVPPAIAFGSSLTGTPIHCAHLGIAIIFPIRSKSPVLAHLLVVLRTIPILPYWTITVGSLMGFILSLHAWPSSRALYQFSTSY
jgi:hypothetical protein